MARTDNSSVARRDFPLNTILILSCRKLTLFFHYTVKLRQEKCTRPHIFFMCTRLSSSSEHQGLITCQRALITVCLRNGPFRTAFRPISHCVSAHFAPQNGLFCCQKQAVSQFAMYQYVIYNNFHIAAHCIQACRMHATIKKTAQRCLAYVLAEHISGLTSRPTLSRPQHP